jgi:hypothetical protein
MGLIENPGNCCGAVADFPFTGLEVMSRRLGEFRGLLT